MSTLTGPLQSPYPHLNASQSNASQLDILTDLNTLNQRLLPIQLLSLKRLPPRLLRSQLSRQMTSAPHGTSPRAQCNLPRTHAHTDEPLLVRTVCCSAEDEMRKLTNRNGVTNILTTPSTAIYPNTGPQFSSISAVQTPLSTKRKWGGKPNLLFNPTLADTQSRTGITLALEYPASLHTCRSNDLIDTYDAESKQITSNLTARFADFGSKMEATWDSEVIRNGEHKGMHGKYTSLALHEALQGKVLFQKGADLLKLLETAIPQTGAALRQYVVAASCIDAAPEIQRQVFESHANYVKFLESTGKHEHAPHTIKAYHLYRQYLATQPQTPQPYFQGIGRKAHSRMRQELLREYQVLAHEGHRHNEFVGRLFPWEVLGIEVGHIHDNISQSELREHLKKGHIFAQEFTQSRAVLLTEIQNKKTQHPVVEELISGKNALLAKQNEALLSKQEKDTIVANIIKAMQKDLRTYAYRQGQLQYIDVAEDLDLNADKRQVYTLTKASFIQCANQLRQTVNHSMLTSSAPGPHQQPLPLLTPQQNFANPVPIRATNEHKTQAQEAVKLFLKAGYSFELYTKKSDSGAMVLALLAAIHKNAPDSKNKSDQDLILDNIQDFSIDTCMSILSTIPSKNFPAKAHYEANPTHHLIHQTHGIDALIDDAALMQSYAATTMTKPTERPLLAMSIQSFKLDFDQLENNVRVNLKQAWGQRHNDTSGFKERIDHFFEHINTQFALNLKGLLELESVADVWHQVRQIQDAVLGPDHDFELSSILFETLGGEWSNSKAIDDEAVFRDKFHQSQWLINPFGPQFRQHKTGRGSLMPFKPSDAAMTLASAMIQKSGLNPFKRHRDMVEILVKIQDPSDRFALHSIFMNQPTVASVSGTTIRLLNFWDEVTTRLSAEDRKIAPNRWQLIELCHLYMAGEKQHHSPFEIERAAASQI